MKTYRGTRDGGVVVTVREGDGDDRKLRSTAENLAHYDWGNSDSGAAHLALSILADLRGLRFAGQWYQLFKWEVVSKLPHAEWTLSAAQINAAMERITDEAPEDEEVWEPTEESQVVE